LGALPFYWYVPLYYRQGIRAVVNTCDEYSGPIKQYKKFGMEQLRIPIPDYFPPTLEDVIAALEFINIYTEKNESVLIHCKAGRGRSTTIVLCYLIKKYGMSPKTAQEFIGKIRPQVSLIYKRKVVYEFVDYLNGERIEKGEKVVLEQSDQDNTEEEVEEEKEGLLADAEIGSPGKREKKD